MTTNYISFEFLWKKTAAKKVISIAGTSGTGKTALGLFLAGNLLTSKIPYNKSCIWIQAGEVFPKKRLESMFKNYPDKLNYLNEHIFLLPNKKPCHSYADLLSVLHIVGADEFIPPPNLKVIVVDNISHHLRFEISKVEDISEKVALLNDFFNNYLLPLLFFCNREDLKLILIHEVTFDINQGINRPFFHKLYDRIDMVNIKLEKEFTKSIMEFSIDEEIWTCEYHLENNGFTWAK